MHHFSSEVLVDLFTPLEIIEIVKNGIKKYAEGKYKVPERMHLSRGESTNLIMPAFGDNYYCTKLISVDPNNTKHDLPVISGLLVLNDSTTGEPLATMDAPTITALRTGAVGSIGLDLICEKEVTRLGIIGLGVQGLWQSIFASSIRNITNIFCYSRSTTSFKSYRQKIKTSFPNLEVTWCNSSEEVVNESEIVIACTTSKNPVFDANALELSSKRFVSVGSFAKDMQELPDQIYLDAEALILDAEAARNEVGDVINTLKSKWISPNDIHTLADLANNKMAISNYKNIVFKSVGMAAFDLALAEAVYNKHRFK
ncbi:MAG: ornithine cyclodeaminase family protein [Bacteroidota bacterium]